MVDDRRQTQHLEASVCGVPQWGQRHIAMVGW